MKKFTAYTEGINREKIEEILSSKLEGFTIFPAIGVWQSIKENSLIIELISDKAEDKIKLISCLHDIKAFNQQQAVLLTESNIDSKLL